MGLRGYIGLGMLLAALIAWVLIDSHLTEDKRIRDNNAILRSWQNDAVDAIGEASGNDKITRETAIGQVRVLGDQYDTLKRENAATNRRLDEMAAEAIRLRKRADELQAIAAKAEAMRRAALARLSDMTITPGTREDCLALVAEANAALDLVREAGL